VSATTISPEQTQGQDQQKPQAKPRQGVLRTMWRLLRQLFHETMGALFAAMGLAWTSSAVRAWRAGEPRWIVVLPVLYAGLMGYFAVTSFLKSRKVV
jgi:hypothetical protein